MKGYQIISTYATPVNGFSSKVWDTNYSERKTFLGTDAIATKSLAEAAMKDILVKKFGGVSVCAGNAVEGPDFYFENGDTEVEVSNNETIKIKAI